MNESMRAALDPVILALLDQEPDHGYSLMLRIRSTTGLDVSDGSLYPALRRLEDAGRIEGVWTISETGRKRKVFHLTADGKGSLHRARADWPAFARSLSRLLKPKRVREVPNS